MSIIQNNITNMDISDSDVIIADSEVTIVDLTNEMNDNITMTSSAEQCAICLDTIIKEQECINNCGHRFCKSCLDHYLDSGKTECPLCRQNIQYFEHNSELYRLILKQINQRQQPQINPNTIIIDRKKFYVYRFIFGVLLVINLANLCMSNLYTDQNNILLKKYNECKNNNTLLSDRIDDLTNDIHSYNEIPNHQYGVYLIIDKLRGLSAQCLLPTNLIDMCFNIPNLI